MTRLKLVANNDVCPKDLAFEANKLYVHIASKLSDSQFKENMLQHVANERAALIMQVEEMFKRNEQGLK